MNDLEQKKRNDFVLARSGSFLQSFEWGKFQENFGRKVFRSFSEKSTPSEVEGLGWQAQFIEYSLPMGKKYFYCPRGPIVGPEFSAYDFQEIIGKVRGVADKNTIFFRISPEWPKELETEAKLEIGGFKKLRYDIEPSQTLILDLGKSEEELLAQMHPKCRYNIGLAQKKGLSVKIISGPDENFEKYFAEFWRLMEQTAKRQKIRLHEKEYYRKQLNICYSLSLDKERVGVRSEFRVLLFIAEHENKVIAANIVNFYNQRATYLHGGSDNEHRSLMAPHLLQWEQIKEAKKQGCNEYDFWGINEKKWPGVTRFKKGFNGREVNYIGTWDYPIDKKWYLVYKGVQKFRRK